MIYTNFANIVYYNSIGNPINKAIVYCPICLKSKSKDGKFIDLWSTLRNHELTHQSSDINIKNVIKQRFESAESIKMFNNLRKWIKTYQLDINKFLVKWNNNYQEKHEHQIFWSDKICRNPPIRWTQNTNQLTNAAHELKKYWPNTFLTSYFLRLDTKKKFPNNLCEFVHEAFQNIYDNQPCDSREIKLMLEQNKYSYQELQVC